MKRFSIHILAAVSAVLPFACSKDVSSICSDSTMGFVTGEARITTDEGLVYNIMEGSEKIANLELGTRIMAGCIVMECTDEEKDEFDVKLRSLSIPFQSVPLESSEYVEAEWPDAINASQAWLSPNGYLNILCQWVAREDSDVEHSTALVHEKTAGDTVFFRLLHNGRGEGYYIDSKDPSSLEVTSGMATFPVQDYISAGNVVIKLSWIWHRTDGYYIYPETEAQSAYYSYSAD